jgi:hypothetical protein
VNAQKRPPPKGENGGGEQGIFQRRFNIIKTTINTGGYGKNRKIR